MGNLEGATTRLAVEIENVLWPSLSVLATCAREKDVVSVVQECKWTNRGLVFVFINICKKTD